MRDGDSFTYPGGSQVFAPLQHLIEDSLRLLRQLQQRDQTFQDLVFVLPLKIEIDDIFAEELTQFHSSLQSWRAAAVGTASSRQAQTDLESGVSISPWLRGVKTPGSPGSASYDRRARSGTKASPLDPAFDCIVPWSIFAPYKHSRPRILCLCGRNV